MCISVLSTAHPEYPFVLISNRDEYINRPTLKANWWDPPHQQVLGGRDTQRQERGTWLGITKQGRIAILTNFREEGVEVNKDKSRGAITNSYLCIPPASDESEEDYVRRLLNDVGIHDVGGFTLIFGKLRAPTVGHHELSQAVSRLRMISDHQTSNSSSQEEQHMLGLAVVSNRTDSAKSLKRIGTHVGETHGLSNSHYGDTTWPKVTEGEAQLQQAIRKNISNGGSQSHLIGSLFDILSIDRLPKRLQSEDWNAYVRHMRDSIMISPAKGDLAKQMAGYIPGSISLKAVTGAEGTDTPDHTHLPVSETSYGTSKQTVILVSKEGKATYVERTLYDREGRPVPDEERDLKFEFQIEGWENS